MVIIRSSLLSPAGRHFHLWLRVRITFRILLSSRQSRRWNDSTVNTDHDELLDRGRWRGGGREDLRLPAFALTIFARRLVPLPRWLPIISQWKPSIELFYICWSSYFSYLEIEKNIYWIVYKRFDFPWIPLVGSFMAATWMKFRKKGRERGGCQERVWKAIWRVDQSINARM